MTFEEMVAQRERESREFYEQYAGNPEKLAADLSRAIDAMEGEGYIVRSYESTQDGKLYEIMHSDYSTVYGFGSCDAEKIMRFYAKLCENKEDEESTVDSGSIQAAPLYEADQSKEREYDLVHNEGGDGYNPYRIGSAHTYDGRESFD